MKQFGSKFDHDTLALALTAGITVYDTMYLTLAIRLEAEVMVAIWRASIAA